MEAANQVAAYIGKLAQQPHSEKKLSTKNPAKSAQTFPIYTFFTKKRFYRAIQH